ncbi:AraC family transcriptional regulator [Brucella pseudogrignonensis]|uniref:AraC family transcriptional regulator n=1 Tax=Brucella pseudogrignonensis TaxID=419475 RepID=UPI00124E868A|nr:AraC family transcriptional regulator [Brucella pseudogrignonensis]KAB2683669.1 helix-turn-helix transcriptional regulator [Brucella pseudogrignonensis]
MTAIQSAKDSFGCDKSDLLVDKSFQVNALKFHLKRGRNVLPHQVRNLASSDDHLIGVSLSDNHYRTVWHSSHSERHKFNAGDIYLRTMDSDYSAELTGSFNFLLIEIDAHALAQMSHDTGMEKVNGLRRSIATADPVLGGLAAVISLNTSNELLIESASLAIANHLCTTYGIDRQRKLLKNSILSFSAQRNALEYISTHLSRNITVGEIAKECALSTSAFTRSFTATFGKSPYQWITDARLDLACDLMISTPLSISKIATLCGFHDNSHFGRVFLHRFGMRPGAWRQFNEH